MKSTRVLLLCAVGLATCGFVGCQKEEPTAPPPAPAAAPAEPAKTTPPARGSSTVNENMGSGSGKDTTQRP